MQQIADLFCGAGGTSTGVLQAAQELGRKINLVAVNHWDLAIATHSDNHPYVDHYNSDLEDIDPRQVIPSGKLRLLVASPECTHFSRARGGKPMSKQSRASIKYILSWVNKLQVEDVLIENVAEFQDWGPLYRTCSCGEGVNAKKHLKSCTYQRPIVNRKGEYFHRFINKMREIGYTVDWRVLNAADYGDPTTRRRLFIIARKKKSIKWPEPSHHKNGGDMFGPLPRWRSARECLDFTIESESIFRRKKGPLVDNTLKKIWAGFLRFGGKAFLIGQQSGSTPRDIDQPVPTIVTIARISFVEPYLVEYHNGPDSEKRTKSIDEPLPTLDTNNRFGLVEPFILPIEGIHRGNRPRSLDEPLNTVTSRGGGHLVEPYIVALEHSSANGKQVRTLDEPLQTLTSQARFGLVEPFLITTNWQATNRSPARSINDPVPTIIAHDSIGLAQPYLVEYYGTGQTFSIDEPMKTLTARDRFGLVEPILIERDGKKYLLDFKFRMLQPHELARAMSFPDNYRFKGTREQIVKQIGNAVPKNLAKALAKSLLQ